MLHVHTIGRIGKDCQVIAGAHGSFMAMNIAVDDYAKGQNVTTWVSQIQLSITAESIAFINTGKKDSSAGSPDNMAATMDSTPVPPADMPQDDKDDLPF